MIKHVILWNLKDELSETQKEQVRQKMKEGLENLSGKIPGLIEIKVNTKPLSSSNADIILDSAFKDEESLKGYAIHPEHLAISQGEMKNYLKSRVCMDYEV